MRQAVAAIARFTVIGCHRLVKWPAEKWPLVGTKRTNRIGLMMSVDQVKPEVSFRGRQDRFW